MSQSSKYLEELAKMLLEKYYNDRFSVLEIKDRPDLWDSTKNIGVDVTASKSYKKCEAEALLNRIDGKSKLELTRFESQKLDELDSLGYSFYEHETYGISSMVSSGWVSNDEILKSVSIKLKKLNKQGDQNYQEFDTYDLFIFADIIAEKTEEVTIDTKTNKIVDVRSKSEIFRLIHYMKDMQFTYARKFSQVYIYSFSKLYALDVEDIKYKHIEVHLENSEIDELPNHFSKNGV